MKRRLRAKEQGAGHLDRNFQEEVGQAEIQVRDLARFLRGREEPGWHQGGGEESDPIQGVIKRQVGRFSNLTLRDLLQLGDAGSVRSEAKVEPRWRKAEVGLPRVRPRPSRRVWKRNRKHAKRPRPRPETQPYGNPGRHRLTSRETAGASSGLSRERWLPRPAARRGVVSRATRARLPLCNRGGQRVGDIALAFRLTDLGSGLPGRPGRPAASTSISTREVSARTPQGAPRPQRSASEPGPGDAEGPLRASQSARAQPNLKDTVFPSRADSDDVATAENGKTSPAFPCSDASSGRSVSPLQKEGAELDIETNTFCPPPLYYTHCTQEKTPPAQCKITIEPQTSVPEELDGDFLEEKLVQPSTHRNPLKPADPATHESPPMLINPPHTQDSGATSQTTHHPQTEENRMNIVRQLPLLNALLVELSLLCNQPMTSPAHVHPQLAWLYRTEEKKTLESSAKSTNQSESKKDKHSMGDREKSESLQYKKDQVENLKKGKHTERNSGTYPKRVKRGKLLFGLTNTLRLRLKQTNPDMLVVHEKREEYRKKQVQALSTKFRIPSPKAKVLSFVEQSRKPYELPKDKYLDSDSSFAENSDTSRQTSGGFDDPSTTKTKLKCGSEKTVDSGGNRTSKCSLEEIVSPIDSIVPANFTHTNILGEKVDMKVQSPFVFPQDNIDRTVLGKEIGDGQVVNTGAGISENRTRKNSCCESISELKYSDDFTSSCYSEDFCTPEDASSLQAHDCSPEAENATHSQHMSNSSEARLSIRKNNSGRSSVLSPPFSAGSPVLSHKRSHISKTEDKSVEEAFSISTSDLSSSHCNEEKENQIKQNGMHNSKRDQDILTRTGCKSLEKSLSPRTSQVSSYLPSNLSELELNVWDSSTSDHFDEDDDVGSLSISKQCKDICELVINKLPGYTV
ncbi:microtubule-associated protein 10 [Tupaia chinensis]|uniref:microtubule-associated protein 10 n=1 Tax=Tupaia chinensis TaxID=246437 RepID=UPI0003C8D79C|nr:microtubule-associated protein 10 [Tupaia chinensis]